MICTLTQYCSGDQMEKNEMGGPCSTYVWEQRIQGFGGGNLSERDHLGDRGVDGRVIIRWIFRKWDVGTYIGLSWHRIGIVGGHL